MTQIMITVAFILLLLNTGMSIYLVLVVSAIQSDTAVNTTIATQILADASAMKKALMG